MKIFSTCIIVLIVALSSCSNNLEEKKSIQTLRLNIGVEPPCLDPRKLVDSVSLSVVKMCFDGLMRVNSRGVLEPSLAASYSISEDQKTYIFTLKEAQWTTGKQLTAHDFVNSWKELLQKDFPAPSAHFFYLIKGAKDFKEGRCTSSDLGFEALSNQTLQITLEKPNPYFLHLLSTVYFYPYPEEIARANESYFKKKVATYVCNGPFTIKRWDFQNRLILEKNSHYFDKDSVRLDQIELMFIQDPSTELSLYENGDLDWCGAPFSSLSQDAVQSIKKRKDYHTQESASLYYYGFNTELFPLNHPSIRKALSLCIDRKTLIEHVLQIDANLATQFIPPSLTNTSEQFYQDHNKEEAKKLFEQACSELKLKKINFPQLTLFYNSGPAVHDKLAQAVQHQWLETLGINVSLESKEWKVYLDMIKKNQFDIARFGVGSISYDPCFFLEIFSSKENPNNHTLWENTQYRDLVENAKSSLNLDERAKFIHLAQHLLLEEMPIAPLFFYKQPYLKNEKMSEVVIDELNNIDFKWAYFRSK